MPQKKPKTKTERYEQPGVLYGVRCPDEDSAAFERAAHIEGFSTVQQWLLALGRKRARQIIAAAESGGVVRISETVIMPESPHQ